ncbi:HAD-IB family phosphatase [bacterium]|nr:HAD-IB family phosphatase [bacterium]
MPEMPSFTSQLPEPTVRIFADFDGTITHDDVGEALFRHFCGNAVFDRIRGEWLRGIRTAPDAYSALCAAMRDVTAERFETFLSRFAVDETFPRFAAWCEKEGYPLHILSDGSDAYIEPLMERVGLDLPLLANELRIEGNKVEMRFPHFDPRCPEIANCKSNHVALLAQDEDLIIYIGDGSSDFDAAMYADLVFARGELEQFCQEQNVTFRRFYNFTTVREQLSLMLHQHNLRKRERAAVRRRQLWSMG